MTEKEKMLAGMPYDCGDAALLERWHKAKQLLKLYNQTDSTQREALSQILSQLLGSKGKNLWITAPFFCDYGEHIHFGNNCEVNTNCVFLDCNTIKIGDHALIAPNVQIYTVFHPLKSKERISTENADKFPFSISQSAPVTIGNHVWIGGGTIILPGVHIGNQVTIGAGSVVTRDIPDNVLAYGNPCRIIREL